MLSRTSLTLGLVPLALAGPQYHGDSISSADPHSHGSGYSSSSDSSYANYLHVHAYDNQGASSWAVGKVTEYPVQFCNASETAMIRQGLKEAEVLAAHARDHVRWRNSSSFYKKYFGAAGTAEPAGWFDKTVNTDKTGVIFRCDDPDGNCAANESKSPSLVNLLIVC